MNRFNLKIWHIKRRIIFWLQRLDASFNLFGCDWHQGDVGINDNDEDAYFQLSCPDCGALFWTKYCPRCGKAFPVWNAKGWDDICGAISCTSGGDIVCARCAQRYEEDEQKEYENDPYSWMESDIEL